MKKVTSGVSIVIICLVSFYCCFRWNHSPIGEFGRFSRQNDAYYRQVAAGCEILIKGLPPGKVLVPIISGEDNSLPAVLRSLKADSIYVSTNQVLIRFGSGRISSSISWEQNPLDSSKWELIAIAGEGDKKQVVFVK
jgi:hypothetical protein